MKFEINYSSRFRLCFIHGDKKYIKEIWSFMEHRDFPSEVLTVGGGGVRVHVLVFFIRLNLSAKLYHRGSNFVGKMKNFYFHR